MQNEKTFKTKSGYCHILPDKIVLTRNGAIGEISKITSGNNISRILVIYSLLSLSMFYFAYGTFKKGENGPTFLYALAGIYLVYGVIKSLNNSATPIIDRKQIKNVKFHSPRTGATRAYFEILFENENGKLKKRLIMLPGSLSDGKNETEKALEIMKSENMITQYR